LLDGPETFFHRVPNPLSAALFPNFQRRNFVAWVNENVSKSTVQMIPWVYLVFSLEKFKILRFSILEFIDGKFIILRNNVLWF
jgi:hypothetical protein